MEQFLMDRPAVQKTENDHVHSDSRCNLAKLNPSADSDIHSGRFRLSERRN